MSMDVYKGASGVDDDDDDDDDDVCVCEAPSIQTTHTHCTYSSCAMMFGLWALCFAPCVCVCVSVFRSSAPCDKHCLQGQRGNKENDSASRPLQQVRLVCPVCLVTAYLPRASTDKNLTTIAAAAVVSSPFLSLPLPSSSPPLPQNNKPRQVQGGWVARVCFSLHAVCGRNGCKRRFGRHDWGPQHFV